MRKFLLIQLRKDRLPLQDEYMQFAKLAGLAPSELHVWDVFKQDHFDLKVLESYDGIFVGGSSDDPDDELYFNEKEHPFITDLLSLIKKAYEKNIPLFASCMGFHLSVQALGGELMFESGEFESTTIPLFRTEEGKQDPVFEKFPDGAYVLSFHKKSAEILPKDAIVLAFSDMCKYHAFTFPDKDFYAFQFHPELNKGAVIDWMMFYKEKYKVTDEYIAEIDRTFKDTSHAHALVGAFMKSINFEK